MVFETPDVMKDKDQAVSVGQLGNGVGELQLPVDDAGQNQIARANFLRR